MYATATVDDLPHEYYWWLGLQAIGAAIGDRVVLDDYPRVKGNLYVCIYGGSGTGKTRSTTPFYKLLRDALPYEEDKFDESTGTKIINDQGSAEALVKEFSYPLHDPSDMSVKSYAPVRGLLRIDELASFMNRSAKPGSTMKTTLIEMYDKYKETYTHSTITRGKTVVKDPYCQIVSTTQPKAIHSILDKSDAESGFLNRWVFATGVRKVKRRSFGGAVMDLHDSTEYLRGIHAYAGTEMFLGMDDMAIALWDDFFNANVVQIDGGERTENAGDSRHC